ncbi:MAG TPA: YsnF/AvaK domain-containing protein [Gemmatimonadales bacterium]|jgi:uncharacterized protein (TIGR02271 family)|nr:YsnF/AvaK domain-containing protein [Gemmatimonadales bacterium]
MKPFDNPETTRGTGTVVGLFRDNTQAERAIRALKAAGFADRQIGVLMQDRDEQRRFAMDTGTKAGEGAATGAVSGGVLGGILGLLAGVGALAIPGIGPAIAGGALASTLTGAGIGAAAGGLIGALIGMGIPEEDARYYESGFREGGILVTVDAGADADLARRTLFDSDAEFGPEATSRLGVEDRKRLQLREEELRASKEQVKAGEVRVRKDVVTEEKTIQVPVTREEAVIERHPVSGRPASGDIKKGEEIRIPLSEEEVRVEKRPVVKEEITVGKKRVQDTETVRDTVRREEARVEETGEGRARKSWKGKERRVRYDQSYAGPERRLVTT